MDSFTSRSSLLLKLLMSLVILGASSLALTVFSTAFAVFTSAETPDGLDLDTFF